MPIKSIELMVVTVCAFLGYLPACGPTLPRDAANRIERSLPGILEPSSSAYFQKDLAFVVRADCWGHTVFRTLTDYDVACEIFDKRKRGGEPADIPEAERRAFILGLLYAKHFEQTR